MASDEDDSQDDSWQKQLHVICASLGGLGISHMMRQEVQDVVMASIDELMVGYVEGQFDVEVLQQARKWVRAVPLRFALEVLHSNLQVQAALPAPGPLSDMNQVVLGQTA